MSSSRIKKVLVFGTFDLMHPGHLRFLKFASRFGLVTVSLTTDELCNMYKHHTPVNMYNKRAQALKEICWVSEVVAADAIPNSYQSIASTAPDYIVLGQDQQSLKMAIETKINSLGYSTKIKFAEPYRRNIYQSSKFRLTTKI